MTKALRDEARELQDSLNKEVEGLSLSDFENRGLAVEIYSEVLGRTVWFCSDWEVARQIREDEPSAICYTANELKEIIRLNPSAESIRRINEAKEVFQVSTIIEADKKDELSESREESA